MQSQPHRKVLPLPYPLSPYYYYYYYYYYSESKKFQNTLSKHVYCKLSEIFLVTLKSFIHLLYKFCAFISFPPSLPPSLPPLSFLSCLLSFESLLPVRPLMFFEPFFPLSVSHALKLHPKHVVTGRQEKISVMLRIQFLNPLAFCMVDFALSKVATHPYSQ